MPTCSKCKATKPNSEFSKASNIKRGLQYWCKTCTKEYSSAWYIENAVERKIKTSEWSRANPEKWRSSQAKRRKLNPELERAKRNNRRSRKTNNGGKHTESDIRDLMVLQKGKCPICRASIKDGYHVDHITPLSLGGGNSKSNIQLLCVHCNLHKHAKDPIKYMQSVGFLL